METLRDGGLPVAAECGGACACATCHVYVEDGWFEKLRQPSPDEIDMLDMALAVQPNSRLSCQITCQRSDRRHQGDDRAGVGSLHPYNVCYNITNVKRRPRGGCHGLSQGHADRQFAGRDSAEGSSRRAEGSKGRSLIVSKPARRR